MSFRIMPAQRIDKITETCHRFGLAIDDHPMAAPGRQYLATWATLPEAEAAARVLGIDPWWIATVGVIVADDGPKFDATEWVK